MANSETNPYSEKDTAMSMLGVKLQDLAFKTVFPQKPRREDVRPHTRYNYDSLFTTKK